MELKIINGVKYYPVSKNIQFNLEACHDKLSNMMTEAEEKEDWKLYNELQDKRYEADELAYKASTGWLSGKDYGRAKELATWRIHTRLNTIMEMENKL